MFSLFLPSICLFCISQVQLGLILKFCRDIEYTLSYMHLVICGDVLETYKYFVTKFIFSPDISLLMMNFSLIGKFCPCQCFTCAVRISIIFLSSNSQFVDVFCFFFFFYTGLVLLDSKYRSTQIG